MPKAKRTAKQIAAATKNILAYARWDDSQNFRKGALFGFVIGASLILIAAFIALGIQ